MKATCVLWLTLFFYAFSTSLVLADPLLVDPNLPSPICTKDSYQVNFSANTKILYIKINSLCKDLAKPLGVSLKDIQSGSNDLIGYVLDLRQTENISDEGAVSGVLSIFLPPNLDIVELTDKGKTFWLKTGKDFYQNDSNVDDYLGGLSPLFKTKPIAVLVSKDTVGSADGIAWLLLKENYHRTVLIGEEFKDGISNENAPKTIFLNEVLSQFRTTYLPLENSKTYWKSYLRYIVFRDQCTDEQFSTWEKTAYNMVRLNTTYPIKAQIANLEGSGRVTAEVDTNGKVLKFWVSQSTGYALLDQAMMDAVKITKFQPLNCVKLTKNIQIIAPFQFILENPVTDTQSTSGTLTK